MHACCTGHLELGPKLLSKIIFSSPNSEHQSEAILYALLHISIVASLDALTCDQRKISIACMEISGQGLDLYNEHAPSNVKRM